MPANTNDTDETVRVVVTDTYHETYEVPKEAVEDGLEATKAAIENGAEKVDEDKHGDPMNYRRKDTREQIDE